MNRCENTISQQSVLGPAVINTHTIYFLRDGRLVSTPYGAELTLLFVPARNTARARQKGWGPCSKYSEFADMEKFHTGAGRKVSHFRLSTNSRAEFITSRPPCLVRRMRNGGPCNSGPHRSGRAMASAGRGWMRRVC